MAKLDEYQQGLKFINKINDYMQNMGGGTEDPEQVTVRAGSTAAMVIDTLGEMSVDDVIELVMSLTILILHVEKIAVLTAENMRLRIRASKESK